MKSAFERNLFGVNQYSVINEGNETVVVFEEYQSGKISLEEACKRVGLHEEYKKYESGEMSEEEFSSLMEGLFGAVGNLISGARTKWNAGVQDFKDALMPGQLDAQTKKFNDLQRRKQLIQQRREKLRMMREDPTQFQRTETTKQVVGDSAKTAQQATTNAATAHAGAVQKQDIEDSRQAALRAGTDMYGSKPIEADEVELQGMMAHDPAAVDDALTNIQNLLAQANATNDPDQKAALINQIYQASAAGAEQVKGRLDATVTGSKGGQTTRMRDGRGNRLATGGRRNQPDAGRMRGGRGARMG